VQDIFGSLSPSTKAQSIYSNTAHFLPHSPLKMGQDATNNAGSNPTTTTKTHSLGNWASGSRNTTRNHFVAMVGEFLGTFLFLFFSFTPTQIAVTTLKSSASTDPSVPNTSALLFIAMAFGVSVTVNVWAFYRINGGMLNPAVGFFNSIFRLRTLLSFILEDIITTLKSSRLPSASSSSEPSPQSVAFSFFHVKS
jgi:hypothetical protein